MAATRSGRIYVGPDPVERGYGHPGYRGTFTLDGAWVHMRAGEAEWLYVNEDRGRAEWEPLETDRSIPVATIDSVEWEGCAVSEAARMLAEFHEHPNALGEGTNTQALRVTLHEEEHEELLHELRAPERGEPYDLGQIAREIADVVYVAYGSAWAFGIDLDAALREIHRAAMDKMNAGLRREDGKILKPPGFVAPDMTEAVRNAD